MSAPAVLNKKTFHQANSLMMVMADERGQAQEVFASLTSGGDLPTEFELLKVGAWRTPYHGDIMITSDDITAYVDNFANGYGVSGAGKLKLPINYAHESWEKAAGWFVPAASQDGMTLMATEVEWTPAAAQALRDGEWKCISAEFCPAGRGGWIDPLDENHVVPNVLTGCALTNIPLYSILEPVMASAMGKPNGQKTISLLIASEHKSKESHMPTLQEVLAKNPEELEDADRDVLASNKDSLDADQRKKYGFEVVASKTDNDKDETVANADDAAVLADIKGGKKVVVDADAYKQMEQTVAASAKTVKDLNRKQVEADVLEHGVKRGAIKADQLGAWADKVEAGTVTVEDIKNLPENPAVAAMIGDDKTAGDATENAQKLDQAIDAYRDERETKGLPRGSYSQAKAAVLEAHPELANESKEQ